MQNEPAQEEFLIYGYHPVSEAIAKGKSIQKVILQSGEFEEHSKKMWHDLKGSGINIQRWPRQKLDRLVKGNHQGIVAFVSPVAFAELSNVVANAFDKGETPLLCWLDGVTDVRNVGAIMRSAAGFGVHGIILPSKSGATLTADVVKSSAGAIYHIPLIQSKTTSDTLKELGELGVFVTVIHEKTETEIADADMSNPTCLIMGDEGKGVSKEISDFADVEYKIPMKGEVASLNVSVAAGVVFYEWFKRKAL
ncbi:MAG: 23S rRNA (guanosine(2251)-2'-O)-methyltransferase RlmB [Bacteroidia bacterium]